MSKIFTLITSIATQLYICKNQLIEIEKGKLEIKFNQLKNPNIESKIRAFSLDL